MCTFQIGNIRNKNTDGMPQIMLLGGLACSSCWLVYGLMLNDPNVYVSDLQPLQSASLFINGFILQTHSIYYVTFFVDYTI